ncbi:RnfABCDGE type electron transport complex subunit G [candidate division WOR-3 bacterium]|nr:RnfABCDGE type electron transport complex subunit G [candidate division WOR-3 bacterium]
MVNSKAWMVISLVLTCIIAAVALSQVYSITRPVIDDQAAEALKASLSEVLPEAAEFAELEPGTVWSADDAAGNRIGIVCKTSPRGYGGPVTVIVGLDTTGRITAIGIGANIRETPGLGLKAREAWFRDQFRGKTESEVALKRDNGTIDAISAATITSRAVTDGVKQAITQYSHYLSR